MKVLQLIQRPQLRGAEIFACLLSEELIRRGHEAVIVTVFDDPKTKIPFNGRILSLNGSTSKRLLDLKAWKKLASIVRQENPDIIQANAGDTLKYAVFSKLLFRWKIPLVFRNASTVSLYIKKPWARWWNGFLYSATDHIVSVSEHTKNDFLIQFPKMSSRISVGPIGIAHNQLNNRETKKSNIVLLHVGGFTFEKNHVGLIKIFERIVNNHPSAVLWLVGDGPLKPEIEQMVRERSFTEKVTFFGAQRNVLRFFQQADLFLLPSIIEGLPAVILESFSCKVPVVAYDVGGVGELITNSKTGWLVKIGDAEGFAQAVSESLKDEEKNALVSSNAYNLLVANYYIEKVTDAFIDKYIILSGRVHNI